MGRRIVVLLAGLVVLAGCSRSAPAAYTSGAGAIRFTGAGFDLHAAGPVGRAESDLTWAGVLDTLNRYLDAGVLTPLRSGGPAGDLAPLFTGPAAARVTAVTPDRFAFIDENLPPVTDVRSRKAVATLTALAGPDSAMSVVTADLDLHLTGWVGSSALTVDRTGELVLVPEGSTWRIDAYDLQRSEERRVGKECRL